MKHKIFFLLLALLVSVAGIAGPAFGTSYFVEGVSSEGGWHDADKTWANDDYMCWAGAASNILAWTGWGFPTTQSFNDHDDIFGYYRGHWTNQGGWMDDAWDWWFDGTNPSQGSTDLSQVDTDGGGFWDSSYTFTDYYYGIDYWDVDGSGALSEINTLLGTGYGVTLAIYSGYEGDPNATSHAITVWGYKYDDENDNYSGIYITDSDDAVDEIRYIPVAQNTLNDQISYWYLAGSSVYIGAIQALEQKPVPEPATMLLLGSGLIGLGIFRRKFRKRK